MLYMGSDEVTVDQVDVTGSVSLGAGSTIAVVPEPGTALLVGLGLATLAFVKHRDSHDDAHPDLS